MRKMHDLSRYHFTYGRVGRILVPQIDSVLPGDRVDITLQLRLELSPLQYKLRIDPRWDIYSYYMPLRHVLEHCGYRFDQNPVIRQMEDGIDYSGDSPWNFAVMTHQPIFLGRLFPIKSNGKYNVPLEFLVPYLRAWDEYFRHPTLQQRILTSKSSVTNCTNSTLGLLDDPVVAKWGLRPNNLKTATTAFTDFDLDDDDKKLAVSSDSILLTDLDKQVARLGSEAERELFEARYRDILDEWGGYAPTDADNRPRMLSGNRMWIGGSNLQAMDQGGLGTMRGVTAGVVNHRIPPFKVPEHGVVFTMACLRFPVINAKEVDQGLLSENRSYLGAGGEARYMVVQEPYSVEDDKFYQGASDTTVRGYQPYGNWWRYQPSFIHPHYESLEGMPFHYGQQCALAITDKQEQEYEDLFHTSELGHYELGGKIIYPCARALPGAAESMMPLSRGLKT